MHLLVIEDNPDLVANAADFPEDRGHTLDIAYNSYAGLGFALESDYDALILDLMLRGIDGLEVCARLRAAGRVRPPCARVTWPWSAWWIMPADTSPTTPSPSALAGSCMTWSAMPEPEWWGWSVIWNYPPTGWKSGSKPATLSKPWQNSPERSNRAIEWSASPGSAC